MVETHEGYQEWKPFAERNGEWDDLTPIPQYKEGLAPICAIVYTQEFSETMNYFRAITKAGEISERAFKLTQDVIGLSEGNYTAWFYRRKCIEGLGLSIADEM